MDDTPQTPSAGFRDKPVWLIAVAALVVAQAGLALDLFGPERPWAAVTDDRPILSGRHPLHLYHGTLGASAFTAGGVTTCYDPQFQAGYPKTPVFDGGSRPAELFLFLGGGKYRPAAYKLGLFAFLLAVPVAFVAAARGVGVPVGVAVLSGVGGIVLGWSEPIQRMIGEGQLDVLAASLAAVVFVAWLSRYARTSGVDAALVLAATAVVGWYFHPLIWLGLGPIVLVYYLIFAPRHGPAWHLGLAGVTFAGIAPNAWWLVDWGKYWWLRQPPNPENLPLPGLGRILGSPLEYPSLFSCLPAGGILVMAGIAGVVVQWRGGDRVSAGLSALASALALLVARIAGAWPAMPPDVPERIVVFAAAFLVPATVYGAWRLLARARLASVATVFAVVWLCFAGWADGRTRPLARTARVAVEPLLIGFADDQHALIAVLRDETTPEARILWDEIIDNRPGWNWSALLPMLTDRAFLGGLDPDSGVEHSYCALCSRQLTGRVLGEWSDADLEVFCRWYNVGWVVARSPAAVERWGRFAPAKPVARLTEGGLPVVVYALDRRRSFVLGGSANWESADARRVTLSNVVPNADGEVQLSLHNLEGLRVFPSYVRVEPMPDPTGRDPVHHVRLRLPGPIPRVTLVWENP
jgi:hypothetical protein